MNAVLTHNDTCRICRAQKLYKALSFGPTPLANAFLSEAGLRSMESYFPLDVYLCKECGLLQLADVVAPEVLFKDYVYVSSTSPVFVAHFEKFARQACERFSLGKNSLVVDIGSNDGILLRPFKKLGVTVLGIEPDGAIAKFAQKSGVETISEFFSPKTASKVVSRFGQADLITATNVFAHINDIHEVAQGVKRILKKDGVFMVEAPYLLDFLEKNLFDTVYHEHLSYFSVSSLNRFFTEVGMELFDVQHVESHGGSLRVFAQKRGGRHAREKSVDVYLKKETAYKLRDMKVYEEYAKRIRENRSQLVSLLTSLRGKGKCIAGYGAPAKGNTLLNYFSIGTDLLDYIVDDSAFKQGKYTPGKRIPVVSGETLMKKPPDYLLIMAWNFAPSIMKKNEAFKKNGGRFIIPIPRPRIV